MGIGLGNGIGKRAWFGQWHWYEGMVWTVELIRGHYSWSVTLVRGHWFLSSDIGKRALVWAVILVRRHWFDQ